MATLTPKLYSPMNFPSSGPVFDFALTRTPEEMALYDRFGEDYQRVETLSPCSQLHLKRLIAYEVPNHPRVMFRNHGDVEGLLACSEVDLPPTPGIASPSPLATPKSPYRMTPRLLKPENSTKLLSPNVSRAWGRSSSKKAGTIPPNVLLNVKPIEMLSAIKSRRVVKKLRFDVTANQVRKMSKSYSDCLEQVGCSASHLLLTLPHEPVSSKRVPLSYRGPGKIRRISRSLTELSSISNDTINQTTDGNNNNSSIGKKGIMLTNDENCIPNGSIATRRFNTRSKIPRLKPNFMEQSKQTSGDHRNH